MSTIFRDRLEKTIEAHAGQGSEECDVCGRKSDAYWRGHRNITICYHCAIDVLPALIADAMRARGRDRHLLVKTEEKMMNRFLRAVALALARDTPTHETVEKQGQEWEERVIASMYVQNGEES